MINTVSNIININEEYKMGPRTDPWGTPVLLGMHPYKFHLHII